MDLALVRFVCEYAKQAMEYKKDKFAMATLLMDVQVLKKQILSQCGILQRYRITL